MEDRQPRHLADRVKQKHESVRTTMLKIAAGKEDIIALGRGDPDLDTPAHIVEAGRKALADGKTHYTFPAGMPELRAAICKSLKRDRGLSYADDEIVVTAGAQEGMFAAMLALVNPGDEVLVPSPGYNSYSQAIELANGIAVPVDTYEHNDFALTAEAIENKITSRTKVLCLINPSNPTGAVTPPNDVRAIAALAEKYNLFVISDEIYASMVFDNAQVLSLAAIEGMKERTITINGFSKTYAMTGWRVGYFAAAKPWVTALAEIHHGLAICAPAVSQYAALAALEGPQDCVEEYRKIFDERRKLMCAALDEMGLTYGKPNGAFYVYANVSSTGMTSPEFCIKLLEHSAVMMFPGTLFGDHSDHHVRISLLQPLPRLKEACDRMKNFIKNQ